MTFYAVANGRTIGIFTTWDECTESVKGYSGAIYKKFATKSNAEAFIENNQKQCVIPLCKPDYYVYTDGACSNNGKPNALAGIGIFFGLDDPRNVSERVEGKQTNNVAELTAILRTYSIIESDIVLGKHIAIVTDSEYSIKCASSYGEKCQKDQWRTEIPNKELVRNLYELYNQKREFVQFSHIKAHTGNMDIHSIGNDQADRLANAAIGLEKCPYAS